MLCRNFRNKRAFTLIELVFVIGLTAIVFFIMIPNYNLFRQRRGCAAGAMDVSLQVRKASQYCRKTEQQVPMYFSSYKGGVPSSLTYTLPTDNRNYSNNITAKYNSVTIWTGANPTILVIKEDGGVNPTGTTFSRFVDGANQMGYYKIPVVYKYDHGYEVRVYEDGNTKVVALAT